MEAGKTPRRLFRLVLVKPSHYDDDGYVIQWFRSPIPANSLACLYGIASAVARTDALGDNIDLKIDAIDETNRRVRPERIARSIAAADCGLVMLVGVQSNQFPRALDIAAALRSKGVTVGIGGFHVSGTLAMLPEIEPNVQKALDLGAFVFAGEAEEGRLEEVLRDAIAGNLKPVYNHMADLPGIERVPTPHLPAEVVRRTFGENSSFDAGRGCPFQCSFCTIINVQGRKSRRRSPDDIERIVRDNAAQGILHFFITDDNFARNKDWEPIFDRLIKLREEDGINIRLIIQVDTLCHRLPNFIEKAARAGVKRVFIGLENVSPDNLEAAKKKQNKITEYRKMLLAWKTARVITYCGYILGFPNDTPERIERDIRVIQEELPVDLLEFFFLTPLPGSEDHKKLWLAGAWMDPDLNKYDLNHAVMRHPLMSQDEWEGAYRRAWEIYYSDEHVERVLRRAAATGNSVGQALFVLNWFIGSIRIEGIHPLECGLVRLKHRRDRRPGLPVEPAFTFYPRFWAETVSKQVRWLWLWGRMRRVYHAIKRDPNRRAWRDTALTPVADDDTETLGIFQSGEAKAYVERERKLARIRTGAA
ncbi:B12-binding domain-containing radical SAM protein [Faunimonas sp. B44]|uniref:B12-binding domain-containing radical SAM protein n=1 Tax=Faunimonas sp. B44 TaxID=3461493 RepID=UPI0040448D1E